MQERELNKFEQINFANYPAVFSKLWNYFPSDILFSLFFGYNCLINENKKKIVFKRARVIIIKNEIPEIFKGLDENELFKTLDELPVYLEPRKLNKFKTK